MKSIFRTQLYFIVCAALWILAAPTAAFAQASNVVTVASEAALRNAMAMGGLVRCSFNGTITLSNGIDVTLDVTLDARGHSVVISGNNSNRIFNVESGVTFSATNVVFANGRNVGQDGVSPPSPGQDKPRVFTIPVRQWILALPMARQRRTNAVLHGLRD